VADNSILLNPVSIVHYLKIYTTFLLDRYHGSTIVSASLTGYVFLLMVGCNSVFWMKGLQ
jgi:hypothetical protein